LELWWPSVYLHVEELSPGDPVTRVGRLIRLHTRGWLPYTLDWEFRVSDSNYPHSFAIEAWGDFVGSGVWSLRQDGADVDIEYDWRIRADKALLRYFSFIARPIFSANHRWAMDKGLESLRTEIERRRAAKR